MAEGYIPKLITFDGEARSGKGTIVKRTRIALEQQGIKTKHIDAGQIFRALAVCATRLMTDFDDPQAVDLFLERPETILETVSLLDETSLMNDEDREAILYTTDINRDCAKVGARPKSQEIATDIKRQWIVKASEDGYEVILFDGRALEPNAIQWQKDKLVDYVMGLYIICNAKVGAKRLLGHALKSESELSVEEKDEILHMVNDINQRNQRDMRREIEPLVRPDAPILMLPFSAELADLPVSNDRPMLIIDTSANMTKDEMSQPVIAIVEQCLNSGR